MDLTFSEEQQAIHELAGRILTDKLPAERLREIETTDPDRFARDAWDELAKSELLGIGLPADVGGGGYGFLETCLVLEQVGRTVAPVPAYATLVLGALPIAEFGDDAQRAAWLPGVVAGRTVLTAALVESGDGIPPARPATTATPVDGGWELSGEKWFVPAAHLAAAVNDDELDPGQGARAALGERWASSRAAAFARSPTRPVISIRPTR